MSTTWSASAKYLCNRMNWTAYQIQLGDILDELFSVADLSLADGKIWVGDVGGIAQPVTISGDVTMTNAGATAIGAKKVVASMVAIADGKVLVGGAAGAAAAQTLSGDVTMSNAGVTAIGAKKVVKGMLADAINAPLMVVAMGEFTTAGGDANESITLASVLGTDTAICFIRKPGAVAKTLDTITPGAGKVDLVFSGDPSTDHKIGYVVVRATA